MKKPNASTEAGLMGKSIGPAVPDAALDQDIAILGKKGRGKTYAAKGIVERLLDMGRRVIVLDPLSTWWGLKAGPNGYGIAVLGGPQGDLPLTDQDGAALGRHLATAMTSAVLDLGGMRKAELVRFATAFLEELYTLNRDPLWLVLEEADVFAPQQPMADNARLLGEVDRIARRGRQFGFKLISLTQRPAKLNKDVLTQLSTLIALGITSPQDRDAIKAWVEGNADRDKAREVVDSLAALKVGEGWVWAPDLDLLARVTFPPIRTLDTSATPKAGEARAAATVRQDIDVAALRAVLDASQEPDRESQTALVRTKDTQRATLQAQDAAERAGFARGVRAAAAHIRPFSLEWRAGAIGSTRFETADRHPVGQVFAEAILALLDDEPERPAPPVEKPQPALTPTASAPLTNGAARKMLAVLDRNPPVRRSWVGVATLAGLRARGGHFNAGRKALLESGLVRMEGDLVVIAQPSANALPEAIDRASLIETWAAALSGGAPKILRHLFEAGPSTKASVAANLGLQPRGGHWNAAWKELRDNELVVETDDGMRLADLFTGSTVDAS